MNPLSLVTLQSNTYQIIAELSLPTKLNYNVVCWEKGTKRNGRYKGLYIYVNQELTLHYELIF